MAQSSGLLVDRECLRLPIPEIAEAAGYLHEAVAAHLAGCSRDAKDLIRRADIGVIKEWSESLWGKKSEFVQHRVVANAPLRLLKSQGVKLRMPTTADRAALLVRDGYHCRFCGIPVIRKEIRERIRKSYPDVRIWGRRNVDQHAAFQAMWVQYDHLLPHCRGGDNGLGNMVITCAPCNFGRMQYTLDEVGLINPLTREPVRTPWDGLENFPLTTDRSVDGRAGGKP